MPNSKIVLTSHHAFTFSDSERELDKLVIEHLKNKKDKKLLSKQDKLALISASSAFKKQSENIDKDRIGIYFAVGTLPFEDKHLTKLARFSQEDGEFSYQKFSSDGFDSMNPLLTFKCLPNMPLFHISYNLEITGRYMMTYPGHNDFTESLSKAYDDLREGLIDQAIVGVSCDQNNILVKHHIHRSFKCHESDIVDSTCSFVLTKKLPVSGDIVLESVNTKYLPFSPLDHPKVSHDGSFYGPSALALQIAFDIQNNTLKEKYTFSYEDLIESHISLRRHQ